VRRPHAERVTVADLHRLETIVPDVVALKAALIHRLDPGVPIPGVSARHAPV